MKTKASLTLLQVLLPITLMLTSCASAPDSSVPDSAGTADTAAADMTTAAAAETDDTAAGASPAEAAAASGPSDGAFDPYALELYDAVPDHLSERHDDVDYGTVDTDVEYYSETAGDVKYCNVLLPAGYDPSQEYPVLYMYHGFGGRYDSHVHEDSILQTLYGNMLHEGLTVPMIIVGADMYTDLLAEKDEKSDDHCRR